MIILDIVSQEFEHVVLKRTPVLKSNFVVVRWDKLGPLISNKNKMIEFSQKDTTAPPQTIPLDELQVVIQLKEICLSDIKLVVLLDVWHLVFLFLFY